VEEKGVVESVNGTMAVVIADRRSGCEGCKEGNCLVSEDTATIECLNIAGATVGQTVRVRFRPGSYLKGTFLVYGLPVIFLFAGAILGKSLVAGYFTGSDPELISAGCGFVAFLSAFVVIKIISLFLTRGSVAQPVIEEIIE
jgi:sigma-E factor negative regulatory protein RseC